jgi:predicted RNase H-like HicB family nuclease
MRTIRILHQDDEVSWGFTSPDIPGLVGGGDTFAEAREMAEGAVRFAIDIGELDAPHDVVVEHYVREAARSAA